MMRKTVLVISLLAGVSSCPAVAGEPIVNTWQAPGDGAFPLPDKGYPDLVGCRMVWAEHAKCFVVAPQFTHEETGYRLFSLARPAWQARPGSAPEGLVPDRWTSPRAYCYLPALKKVLFLKEQWYHSRNRKIRASGWLLDPADGRWEPIEETVQMSDRSADFNPTPDRDGLRLPLWGAVCYDGHNSEAVAFGGGGTWGRVGKQKEKVKPGDWILDEAAKRIRRLLASETGVTTARRWFPAHCGTWVFPEAERAWKPIEQPMGQQPPGRILPGMAYDAAERKIVLFGGDDLARCLSDTWIYDCTMRTWREVRPKVTPQARAGHAMVYVPGEKVVLMAGGYTGGWRPLQDVWVYRTAAGEWTRLALDLPSPAGHASALYDAERGVVVVAVYPKTHGNKAVPVYTLWLDLSTAPKAELRETDGTAAYHSPAHYDYPMPLPDDWLAGERRTGTPEAAREELARLAANVWVRREPPFKAYKRAWGSYVYDIRTHRGYAWGGGHCQNSSPHISEYDLLTNRWRMMADVANYNPVWLHRMAGGPPGVSFGGWCLLASHARKSYGIDPTSDSLITYLGDVYDLRHHQFVRKVGLFPVQTGFSHQVAFVTARHGLYGYATRGGKEGMLYRANARNGTWDLVASGGPPNHHEFNHMCYDSKRDRVLYFRHDTAEVWAFEFEGKQWSPEEPAGPKPLAALADSTYIPELDAALMIFAEPKGVEERLYFYQCAERKWYTAAYQGDRPTRMNTGSRDFSPIYDPELGLVVRLTCDAGSRRARTKVFVMRLDPACLNLTPVPLGSASVSPARQRDDSRE